MMPAVFASPKSMPFRKLIEASFLPHFALLLLFLVLLIHPPAADGQQSSAMPVSQVASHVTLPPGFRATLFAGEPDVHQPIAMTFDDRGRLWVAECYTYSDAKTNFDMHLHDRIVVFEDSNGSGHFDKCKVFWDQAQRLTSIAVGFGGVFATCAPNLIFIPDRDADDVPDGPPEVLLDGWNADAVRHNIVNGLKWGPDGWLYGRHGIMAGSSVGRPGAPESERTKLNGAIWRYHPTRKIFEVVCHGTTNPWGHDWDQFGELFFVNTVIGHLWHGIPGAYYKRMYGESLQPYRYGLIDQTADHYHWDTGKTWQESREPGSGADALGGGHAHSGLMIYQGDNWPGQYRGQVFMVNYHGRRMNEDLLEPKGSGYVAKHDKDFCRFGDPWFRGIDLDYGPDGGVYVLDWSDTGECHENDADGVHRENGRIYKLTYGEIDEQASSLKALSLLTNGLSQRPSSELLKLQTHTNEWFARHARRILQERAQSSDTPQIVRESLHLYETQTNVPCKLRLIFALHALGADSESWLKEQTHTSDEHVRSWAVRFLAESDAHWRELSGLFEKVAATDSSPVVRLSLASALQRAPVNLREPIAAALLQHGEDATDHNLPLMLWYAVEPMAASEPTSAVHLAERSRIPIVRQYIARRLAEELGTRPAPVESLLENALKATLTDQLDVLRGLAEALRGWRSAPQPRAWESLRNQIAKLAPSDQGSDHSTGQMELLDLAQELGVIFRDPWALDQLQQVVFRAEANPEKRRRALEQLTEARLTEIKPLLEKALEDPALAGAAARGLLLSENNAKAVLDRWAGFQSADQAVLVGMMVSRSASAEALLDAIAQGKLPRNLLTAFNARQIRNFNIDPLTAKLNQEWGEVRTNAADKIQLMTKYRALLTPDRLKRADLPHGREVFSQVCAVCHKLFGQGAAIGPDLTGGGRANLDYLLENIVDPSAIVPADYKVSEIELKDDRSYSALIVAKTERTLTIQTPAERIAVDRGDILKIRETNVSLMPEGLLQTLKDEQIANLIAYLMATNQVPLPPSPVK
jgi:putative membrane-bound dehydrogenase-like protein